MEVDGGKSGLNGGKEKDVWTTTTKKRAVPEWPQRYLNTFRKV